MKIVAPIHPEDEPQHLVVVKQYSRRSFIGQFFRSGDVAEVDDVTNIDEGESPAGQSARPLRRKPKEGGFKFKPGS